jgi:hypothetical protein
MALTPEQVENLQAEMARLQAKVESKSTGAWLRGYAEERSHVVEETLREQRGR